MDAADRIYVAGHTGLLGRALMDALPRNGFSNVVTRTRSQLDLCDQTAVRRFFERERPAVVFLAAGLTGGIMANKTFPADFLHVNIAMQDAVFQAAHATGVRTVVFYASSCVYWKNAPQPIAEEALFAGPIEETSQAYAAAKIAGIMACHAYNTQFPGGTRFIALVPNSMYGPGDNFDPRTSHVLSALIGKLYRAAKEGAPSITLWGSGTPRREFIFSGDVAGASLFAVRNASRLENRHYNVGTGADFSIRELALRIAEAAGYRGRIEWDTSKPDGTPRKLLDNSRFAALGWKHTVSFEEGLQRTCEWFVNNTHDA